MKTRNEKNAGKPLMPWRRFSLLFVFLVAIVILLSRALDMQVLHSEFFSSRVMPGSYAW